MHETICAECCALFASVRVFCALRASAYRLIFSIGLVPQAVGVYTIVSVPAPGCRQSGRFSRHRPNCLSQTCWQRSQSGRLKGRRGGGRGYEDEDV
ncbi:unnamed protein product [Protopolystoma xenopodis]|uniref:Uncharacterized protein n=1 Tax=Protopolystoma xenopodis TaxID=117903 RepID=A0A448WHS9_9PLAT|nr:unnamed protein product [Protopolystoma xenopodis]